MAHAQPGVPLAECHDLTLTFEHVHYTSYDVVAKAVVTVPGLFTLGDGHAFFGTSTSTPNPAGEVMTSTATVIQVEPGTVETWRAHCIGGDATATVHVPVPPTPPKVRIHGPSTVRADNHRSVRDPLAATAVDAHGKVLAAHCTPAMLPIVPSRTRVTCTSARDAAGRVGTTTRVVTVLGAAAQLKALQDSLGPSHLRDLVASARDAVIRRDGPAAARRLGVIADFLPHSGLQGRRVTDVRADIQRIARVLGRALPSVHEVRHGETVWSIVTDRLQAKTGVAPDDHAVALGVRLVLAVNPGALDRYGTLHTGTVLRLPL